VTKLFVYFWIALLLFFSAPLRAGEDGTPHKTWKTIAELSATEQAQIDLRTGSPRDPQVPYLPAERFPFSPPYTAEEMGLRSLPGETPIVPIILGETAKAIRASAMMLDEGVFVTGFGFPVVPQGHARVRCQISAAHTRDDLEFALAAFKKVGAKLGLI